MYDSIKMRRKSSFEKLEFTEKQKYFCFESNFMIKCKPLAAVCVFMFNSLLLLLFQEYFSYAYIPFLSGFGYLLMQFFVFCRHTESFNTFSVHLNKYVSCSVLWHFPCQ